MCFDEDHLHPLAEALFGVDMKYNSVILLAMPDLGKEGVFRSRFSHRGAQLLVVGNGVLYIDIQPFQIRPFYKRLPLLGLTKDERNTLIDLLLRQIRTPGIPQRDIRISLCLRISAVVTVFGITKSVQEGNQITVPL